MDLEHNGYFKKQNNSGYRSTWRFFPHIFIFSVLLNIILIIVTIGTCYYFSTEERNWTSSQDFCSLYNASLATIENEEKHFVMRYRSKNPYWIGLTRQTGQPWKWPNGQNATLEVLGEGENCAYLNDEVKAKASVSRCSTEHFWICSRSAHATGM